MDDKNHEDLFRPSLQQHQSVGRLPEKRPWKLTSQYLLAFFGGMLAVTGIAFLNGQRLGLDNTKLTAILVVGVATMIISLTVVWYVLSIKDFGDDERFWVRVILRVFAVGLSGVLYQIQKSGDRIYQSNHYKHDDMYESLWVPGLIAAVALGVLQAALTQIVV